MDVHSTVGGGPRQSLRERHSRAGCRTASFSSIISRLAKWIPHIVEQLVDGMSRACRKAGCALIGGETAEMPGFYPPGEYDLAGFIVGAVETQKNHHR